MSWNMTKPKVGPRWARRAPNCMLASLRSLGTRRMGFTTLLELQDFWTKSSNERTILRLLSHYCICKDLANHIVQLSSAAN